MEWELDRNQPARLKRNDVLLYWISPNRRLTAMLCLTRRPLESVTITVPPSDEPTTVVVSCDHFRTSKQVSLGFTCERKVAVVRTELLPLRAADCQGGDA
jgi:hypothetical protein